MPGPRPLALRSALIALLVGGCYQYTPLPPAAVPSSDGAPVRLHLATPRSFDVSGYTAHGVHRIDGPILERDRDAWVVAAHAMHAEGGARFDPSGFPVTILAADIASTDVRTLSRWRTAFATVGALVGIYLASEALQGTSASGSGGVDGGGDRILVPLP